MVLCSPNRDMTSMRLRGRQASSTVPMPSQIGEPLTMRVIDMTRSIDNLKVDCACPYLSSITGANLFETVLDSTPRLCVARVRGTQYEYIKVMRLAGGR